MHRAFYIPLFIGMGVCLTGVAYVTYVLRTEYLLKPDALIYSLILSQIFA